MNHPKSTEREDFRRVMDALRRAAAGQFEDPVPSSRPPRPAAPASQSLQHVLECIQELWARRSYVPTEVLAEMYSEAPVSKTRPEGEAVHDELRLTSDLTADDLNRIRREFALQNHPDRVTPARREQATRRMTIANALIDEALKQKRDGTTS